MFRWTRSLIHWRLVASIAVVLFLSATVGASDDGGFSDNAGFPTTANSQGTRHDSTSRPFLSGTSRPAVSSCLCGLRISGSLCIGSSCW